MSLAPVSPPPLRDGDRLTADEFLRRWEAMPDVKHAELIDGIVYMPSPVSNSHANYQKTVSLWLTMYEDGTRGCESTPEATWLMGDRQVPQPDGTLQLSPDRGQSRLEGDYWAGAPELIVEIALSSRGRDLGSKLRLYERMRVREYLVVLAAEPKLVWHDWSEQGYQRRDPDPDGIFRSRTFPGLWLDVSAFLRLDRPQMLRVLQQGLASPEHAEFVARLNPPA